jgi:hypothetical protein
MQSSDRSRKVIQSQESLSPRIAQPAGGIVDNRPQAVLQRQLQQMADSSPRVVQAKGLSRPLPSALKAGIENLSGFSLDDVKVHYNSSKPTVLKAHAYAQGTDIHLAPGQEEQLAHEAWHIVQRR